MRRRNKKITVRLDEYEFARLEENVAKTGFSKEAYMRCLIKGNIPAQTPPIEYHKLINLLRNIANNMNQLAATANSTHIIDAHAYNQNVQQLYEILREIQQAILLPKKVTNGNHKNMEN